MTHNTLFIAESHTTEVITNKLARSHQSAEIRSVSAYKEEEELDLRSSMMYLGLHLDKRLTNRAHVEAIIAKTKDQLEPSLYSLRSAKDRS